MTDADTYGHAHQPDESLAEAMWDERYSDADRVWSGEPNGALVEGTRRAAPGNVLDVGCGEGADAVWLARRGWDVTALDVSGVALDRARRAAAAAGVEVHWLHTGLEGAPLRAGGFDLVSAQYPALARTPGNDAERVLLAAVAPGGTLLFVHHAQFGSQPTGDPVGGPQQHPGHHHGGDTPPPGNTPGFTHKEMVGTADVAAVLTDGWQVEINELRSRDVRSGAGAHHTADVVLKARRLE